MTSLYPDEVLKAEPCDPGDRPDIDEACDAIMVATKGIGTDEKAIISILGSRNSSDRFLIAHRYKVKFGEELYDLMKGENSGDFGLLTKLLSLPLPEAEAKIIRIATKGFGTNEMLLFSVIAGRTNEEMDLLKKAYYKRYSEDLSTVLNSELGGDLKKLALACFQGMEEEFDPDVHNESKAEEDAEAFYKAGQGKWGTDEEALFEIICKAPPQHLKMVKDAYVDKYGYSLEKALEKELSGKAEKAAIFALGMKLDPYETVAELIKGACEGLGTDEDALSFAVLRYQHILPQVMDEFNKLYSETLPDLVSAETSGNYGGLLLEMISSTSQDGL